MSLVRAFATVSGLTLLSRAAGFARDILTAALLGAGPWADAFFVALKLPNLFRRLTAEGTFQVVFTPMYAARLERFGGVAANAFAGRSLAALLAVLVPVTALAILGMPALIPVVAPGFLAEPVQFARGVELARIAFVYMPLISVVALLGGVLNAHGRYAPFAAAPVLFNACLIAAMLVLPPLAGSVAHALAWGVALAGVVQVLWMVAALHAAGLRLPAARPRWRGPIKRLVRLMGPGAAAAGVLQLNVLLDTILATLLPAGAVSYLYYADRLVQLPLGVVGIALGVALLPALARQLQAGEHAAAQASQNRGLEFALVLGLPAAAALAVAGQPIVAVLFQRGEFSPAAASATAWAVAAYALGTPGYVVAKVQQNIYFARQDTRTPFKVAAGATALNAGLSVSLMPLLGHIGIALATGIAAWAHVGLFARYLKRDGWLLLDRRLVRSALAALGATGLLAAGLGLAWPGLMPLARTWAGWPGAALALAGLVVAGMAGYFLALWGLGGMHPRELRQHLRRRPREP